MLQIKNLRKEFKDVVAVDDVSFSVEQGKIFGLLGPNGAGKTTTIRTILDIIKPSSGEILLNGKKLNSDFHNITGYLPEERGLYKKSKVIDVIAYFGEIKGMNSADAIKAGKMWLKKLEIEQYTDKKTVELSKGNQQKVQFIGAVIHDPQILVLDEPFSGFDPLNQQLIKDHILQFVNSGKIIILSTHQMELAEKLCSSIFLINKGREVVSGTLNDVKKRFGVEAVKLEYSGDLSFVKDMPEIKSADIYSNYAELEFIPGANKNQFLKSIIDKVEVVGYSVIEPTLHKIFIDTVKQNSGEKNG